MKTTQNINEFESIVYFDELVRARKIFDIAAEAVEIGTEEAKQEAINAIEWLISKNVKVLSNLEYLDARNNKVYTKLKGDGKLC